MKVGLDAHWTPYIAWADVAAAAARAVAAGGIVTAGQPADGTRSCATPRVWRSPSTPG